MDLRQAGWAFGAERHYFLSYRTRVCWLAAARWRQRKDDEGCGERREAGKLVDSEKSGSNQPHGVDEPDFDRIYVLGYDKRNQEHYTAYRSPDLKGYLPVKVEGQGESKSFTIRLQEEEGGPVKEVRYNLYKDARGVLKMNAPNIAPQNRRRKVVCRQDLQGFSGLSCKSW